MTDFLKTLRRETHIPGLTKTNEALSNLSFLERALFYGLLALLALVTLGILLRVNGLLLTTVPAHGGKMTEGIIGTPRFINPLLALSDADRDVTALVYSGLLRATPEGTLVPDIASSYSVSPDGLVYTFILREDATFHDGTPVTADDVVFTVTRAQDTMLKSPIRVNWEGVRVEKHDTHTVAFTLPQPYSPFPENVTLGILPKHLWHTISSEQFPFSEYNSTPIGSGPYRVEDSRHNSSGIPTHYTLKSFGNYALGEPFIDTLSLRFFGNATELERAVRRGDVEAAYALPAASAAALPNAVRIETHPLPRIFAVFFNQNEATVFANREVRRALAITLNKARIVDDVLSGFGTPIDSPIPPGIAGFPTQTLSDADTRGDQTRARQLLSENGWKPDEETGVLKKKTDDGVTFLRFSLATSNAPELKRAAEDVADEWEALGAAVELQFFNIGTLNQEVIRPRAYDALLFGQIIGRDLDPFAFWHSSQRNDPGLNIALYANITADDALEDIRTTLDAKERERHYETFEVEVQTDTPAVFLYTPDFIYTLPEEVKGFSLGTVTTPAERFLNVHQWHIRTTRVWPLFSRKY